MTRFLVTGKMRDNQHVLGLSIRVQHLAPVCEIEAPNEDAAKDELAKLYPGTPIYHLRLWRSVGL